MPRENVTILGLGKLDAALRAKAAELRAGAVAAVAEEVVLIKDDAQERAPRLTGDLEEHIRSGAAGTEGSIRSTSRHAGFMEFGTFKDAAQAYMKPAADKARRRFPKRAADIIRAALGG